MKKFLLVVSIVTFPMISLNAMQQKSAGDESGENIVRPEKKEKQARKFRGTLSKIKRVGSARNLLLSSPRREPSEDGDRIERVSSNDSSTTSPRTSGSRVTWDPKSVLNQITEEVHWEGVPSSREGSLLHEDCEPAVLKKVSSRERLIMDKAEENIQRFKKQEKDYIQQIATLREALNQAQINNAALENKCKILASMVENQGPPLPASGRVSSEKCKSHTSMQELAKYFSRPDEDDDES